MAIIVIFSSMCRKLMGNFFPLQCAGLYRFSNTV